MRFPIPELPENFDDGLREPSELEMALAEKTIMFEQYEALLSDLIRYYAVGHLAEWEYRTQAGAENTDFSGISDSHPIAEAGLRLQAACSELYAGLRGAESAMSLTENMELEQFAALVKQGDLNQTDHVIIESRNELDSAWSAFCSLAEDRVDEWLSEADSRIANID
jgi:hypothetical protein